MPRRKSNPIDYKYWIGIGITLISWIVLATTFYVTTKSTLDQHTAQFKEYGVALEKIATALKSESDAREKIRHEYLTDARKTSDGIAELNKQIAVTVTRYDMMLTALNKMQEQFERQRK